MREVAVHLEHELGTVGERAAEAGDVGRAQALLARTVQDADERKLGGQLVGQLAGAVGGGVVDRRGRGRPRAAPSASARTIGSRFSSSL